MDSARDADCSGSNQRQMSAVDIVHAMRTCSIDAAPVCGGLVGDGSASVPAGATAIDDGPKAFHLLDFPETADSQRRLSEVDDMALYDVFWRYCAFGASRNTARKNHSLDAVGHMDLTSPAMDSARFAKIVREAALPVDVAAADIAFSRACERGERRVSFLQFRSALQDLAERAAARTHTSTEDAERSIVVRVRSLGAPRVHHGSSGRTSLSPVPSGRQSGNTCETSSAPPSPLSRRCAHLSD